ncbi:MAG: hypothetical protein M3X11_04670 [Acidobacteriota bacterium]|nr:hypothetical protein [Acidobacteriota bacterium]
MKRPLLFSIAATLLTGAALFAQQPQRQLTPEQQAQLQAQQAAAREDHQRMLRLLGIKELRPGANGSNPQAPNYANYDEAKVKPYSALPDPLVLKNGKKVTSAMVWWNERRTEIVEDFDREVYGRMPKVTPKVKWEVTSTTNEVKYDVPVVTKQLTGHVDNSSYPQVTVDIKLTLITPANAKAAMPVIMELMFQFPRRRRAPEGPTTTP